LPGRSSGKCRLVQIRYAMTTKGQQFNSSRALERSSHFPWTIFFVNLLGLSSAVAVSSEINIHQQDVQIKAMAISAAGQSSGPSSLTYYVDGLNGNDQHTGTSTQEAWQSIARINEVDFDPGDQVLFAGGQTFTGTLLFEQNDSGTQERPIEVSSFGNGRALIHAGTGCGFQLHSCAHVVVSNLTFVGCGRKSGNNGSGVQLRRTQHVKLDSLEVSGFRLSGVYATEDENTRITNVYAHENGAAGILTYGRARTRNLYIGYCVAANNPGDPKNLDNHSGNGILAGCVDDGLIEYCEAFNNGWDMPRKGNGPFGIWGYDCDRLIIQHCISHDNKTASGASDGGGFDLDGGATRSVLQYNLSYNNHGCGYFFCQYRGAKPWKDNTCRYNVSINDGLANQFCGIMIWTDDKGMSNAQIYNNVVINSRRAIYSQDIPGLSFHNNILIADKVVIGGRPNQAVFMNNLYHMPKDGAVSQDGDQVFKTLMEWAQAKGKETVDGHHTGFAFDPKLVLPDDLSKLPKDPRQLKNMPFYRLQADSPCIGVGTAIEDNGAIDFFGNPVPSNRQPSLGVHEPNR
jgi:hypothetical protein